MKKNFAPGQACETVSGKVTSLRESAEKAALTRRPELFQVVALQAGASGLRDALTAALRQTK